LGVRPMPTRERVASALGDRTADLGTGEMSGEMSGAVVGGGGSVANDSDSEGSEFQDAQAWEEDRADP
jgi:hypothetical protein